MNEEELEEVEEVEEDQPEDQPEEETEAAEVENESFEGSESLNVFVDLERTKETIFYTPNGDIHIIHSITLGDIITILFLVCILIFLVLDRVRG